MATDEAILTLVGEGHSPPTLRFYTWTMPWVSLGSGQMAADVDPELLDRHKWKLARRASGGTAVLHEGQLGYAIILPKEDPVWNGDLIESYERLSAPFANAFTRLGVPAVPASRGDNARFTADSPAIASRSCFGALGPSELLADNRKIIGNSQIRRRHSTTQHGVIQVTGNQSALADVIATNSAAEREELRNFLASHVDSLEGVAGHAISTADLTQSVVGALRESLGVQINLGRISDRERGLASELIDTKYGNDAWTYRR